MTPNKPLILRSPEACRRLCIQLLVADMKHEQLIAGLGKLGFTNEVFECDLSGVVLELMGIPEENMSWEWSDVYMDFIRHAGKTDIHSDETQLLQLAESSYHFLLSCVTKEKTSTE